jgi:hypothetical protein
MGQPFPLLRVGALAKPSALPVEGPSFLDRTAMPLRSNKAVRQWRLLKTYADEAARLRKLASNITTARLRFRLLEEAANEDWLAHQAKEGGSSPDRGWPWAIGLIRLWFGDVSGSLAQLISL